MAVLILSFYSSTYSEIFGEQLLQALRKFYKEAKHKYVSGSAFMYC